MIELNEVKSLSDGELVTLAELAVIWGIQKQGAHKRVLKTGIKPKISGNSRTPDKYSKSEVLDAYSHLLEEEEERRRKEQLESSVKDLQAKSPEKVDEAVRLRLEQLDEDDSLEAMEQKMGIAAMMMQSMFKSQQQLMKYKLRVEELERQLEETAQSLKLLEDENARIANSWMISEFNSEVCEGRLTADICQKLGKIMTSMCKGMEIEPIRHKMLTGSGVSFVHAYPKELFEAFGQAYQVGLFDSLIEHSVRKFQLAEK